MKKFVAILTLAVISLAGCGGTEPDMSSAPVVTTITTTVKASPTSAPDRDGDGVADRQDPYPDDAANIPTVTVECGYGGPKVTVKADAPDFTALWAKAPTPYNCEAERGQGDLTAIEQAALSRSGVSDVEGIYESCAWIEDGQDHYPSREKIPYVVGSLELCPTHPHTDLRKLTADGRIFRTGTWLVGSEIKPGTYAVTDPLDGCYWERQDANGNIIDNNFVTSARRVQVNISPGDYAFMNERCGEWRPV